MVRNLPIWRTAKHLLWLSCSVSALCWGGVAGAQTPATEPTTVEQVVVTGSHLTENGFQAPTPVTAVSADALKQSSPDNIADALNELPQFHGSTRSDAGSTGGIGGTNGQNLLNLRSLGAQRTLVLLNGQRLPPSNSSGSVDINVIPDSLISRVDVVTGGASAAYGSDAVAGVVNFILDTHYTGMKVDVSGGITTYGDSATGKVTATYGSGDLLGGRFRVIASGGWFHQDGIPIGSPTGRNWFDNAAGRYACAVSVCGTANFIGRGLQSSTGSAGGTITSINTAQGTVGSVIKTGPLADLQFGAGGALTPFPFGQDIGSQYMIGGGSGISLNTALSPAQTRVNAFLHTEYDLSGYATIYLEGIFAQDYSLSSSLTDETLNSQGQFTIYGDNAYLPSSVKALLSPAQVGHNVPVFGLSRINMELPPARDFNLTQLKRISGGVTGNISDRWKYTASLAYAESYQDIAEYDLYNAANFYAAADAVTAPGGQIVCRSNLTGGNPGCVPINVFGPGSISSAGAAYIVNPQGTNAQFLRIGQTVFDLSVSGDLGDDFQLGAGPISVAAGFDSRREDYRATVDAGSAAVPNFSNIQGVPSTYNFPGREGSFTFYNPQPSNGLTTANEGYFEIGVPLLKDVPFAENLDLNAAVRETDYNLSGLITSYKAGLTWQAIDDIRFRGTLSQDIRAPNAGELFATPVQVQNNQTFPCAACANAFTRPSISQSVGNPDLKPEIGHTTTAGAVYQPEWIPGLTQSVDYYIIKVSGFIEPALVAQDSCNANVPGACARILINGVPITNINQVTPTTTGAIQIINPQANIAERSISGLDFETNYTTPLWDGALTANVFANLTLDNITTGAIPPDSNGVIGTPGWSSQLSLHYDTDEYGIYMQERLIGPVTNSRSLVVGQTVNCCNSTPTYGYTDATLTYKFEALDKPQELFLSVQNIFDKDPPVAPGNATNYISYTNFGDYDALGRRFTVGIRMKL